jgi:hypothetical protein
MLLENCWVIVTIVQFLAIRFCMRWVLAVRLRRLPLDGVLTLSSSTIDSDFYPLIVDWCIAVKTTLCPLNHDWCMTDDTPVFAFNFFLIELAICPRSGCLTVHLCLLTKRPHLPRKDCVLPTNSGVGPVTPRKKKKNGHCQG